MFGIPEEILQKIKKLRKLVRFLESRYCWSLNL